MPHRIVTKDGIVITDIPDDVSPTDPRLKDQVAQLRSAGQKSAIFGQQLQLTPERAAAVDPESVMVPGTGVPPTRVGQVKDLVMSEPRVKDLPTALGTMGAVVRGAGPVAAGTALGAAAGSVIPGVGTLAGGLAGGGAMGAAQFVGDPLISGINRLFGTNYTLPTDAIEDLFTRIGVAEPKTEAEKLVQTISQGAAGAGSEIMLGQALQMGAGLAPSTKALVGKAIASGPLQQILGGAGASGASGYAAQQGKGPLVQFGAGLAGGIAGSGLGSALSLQPGAVNPMQATVDDSARYRTQLMTSDVFPPKTFAAKTGQAIGEKIPVIGTGPMRATQQADRIKDVKDLLRQFGAEDAAAASDDVMADLLEKRSRNLSRWTGMKNKVIDDLSGGPIGERVEFVGPKELKKVKSMLPPIDDDDVRSGYTFGLRILDDSYDDFNIKPGQKMSPSSVWDDGNFTDEMLDGTSAIALDKIDKAQIYQGNRVALIKSRDIDYGGVDPGEIVMKDPEVVKVFDLNSAGVVPMPTTTAKIDASIDSLKGLKTAEVTPVISKLEDWKQAIQGQDIKNIELLRKQIGETFTAPDMAAVRSTGQRVLSDIYGAVKDDMTEYIKKFGSQQTLNKWQVANKELSKMMGNLDLGILKSTLEKGAERPEVVKNMLFSKDRSVIKALNKNLTAKGRESARTAIMQEIGKKIGKDASPEKFLSEMRKMKAGGDPVGVFFTGDDLKAVEGLTRVLKATSRASQAALNPPTGVQAVIPLSLIGMGGGSVALEKYFGQGLPGLLASVGVLGAAGGGARLYESPAVRNILMKLPTVKPGSVEEAALFKRLIEAAQAVKPKKDEALER